MTSEAAASDVLLEARFSRWQMGLLILGSFAFVALGIFIIAIEPHNGASIAAGALSIVFFGLCGLTGLWRAADSAIVLRIDGQGVYDRRVADAAIPWAAIAGIGEQPVGRQMLFGLTLSQPVENFITSPSRRRLFSANKFFGFDADIYIAASGLTVSPKQIREALVAGAARHLRQA